MHSSREQRKEPNILRHPGLHPLWESVHKEWRQQQLAALLLLLVGIAFTVLGDRGASVVWLGIGGLAICGSLYWLFRLLSRKPVSEIYHLLSEEADSIVWVYGEVTERLPFGIRFSRLSTLYLVLSDGEEFSYSLPAEKTKLVTKTLNRVLPSAEFGYTPERELRYRGEILRRRRPNIDG